MKKIFGLGAICATVLAASCAGNKEAAPVEPTADATAWSDTIFANDGSGIPAAITINNYNDKGQMASANVFTISKDGKQTLSESSVYQNGLISLSKDYDEAGNTVVGTHAYTYDAAGKISSENIKAFNKEENKMVDKTALKYTYNAAGDITNVTESSFSDMRWTDCYFWEYMYDDQARLSERKDYAVDGKERRQSAWFVYTYNDKNQCAQRDFYRYDLKTNRLKHDAKSIYTYNDANQVLTETVIRHKNNNKREDINSRKYDYSYNPAGQQVCLMSYRWNSSQKDWMNTGSYSCDYDAEGRLAATSNITMKRNVLMPTLFENYAYKTPANFVKPASAAPAASTKAVVNVAEKFAISADSED